MRLVTTPTGEGRPVCATGSFSPKEERLVYAPQGPLTLGGEAGLCASGPSLTLGGEAGLCASGFPFLRRRGWSMRLMVLLPKVEAGLCASWSSSLGERLVYAQRPLLLR